MFKFEAIIFFQVCYYHQGFELLTSGSQISVVAIWEYSKNIYLEKTYWKSWQKFFALEKIVFIFILTAGKWVQYATDSKLHTLPI